MIKKIILIILTISWMVLIFLFSNQKSVSSDKVSESFINSTIVKVYKVFKPNATPDEVNKIVSFWNGPVRKLAHFMEYFVLGILVFLTFKEFNYNNIFVMILICFLYAYSDEFHQLFVLGRSGKFADVLLDLLGSISSIILFNKIMK